LQRYASLSLDLDNQWSYMKIHGEVGWDSYPSYIAIIVPRVLEILDQLGLKITFFVVGRDLDDEYNQPYLKEAIRRGHELANHSFSHDTWLHLCSKEQIQREIVETEVRIEKLSGQRPLGFRGPGFCWSPDLLETLTLRGYIYDATTLPTFIGPLARWYYFKTSILTEEDKRQRSKIFGGGLAEGFGVLRPFEWRLPSGNTILEIPVTTMPVLRVPFHMSYLLYLSRVSNTLMRIYLSTALALCRLTGTAPSFLLHPLDLLGGEEVPELAFFPGMDISAARKREIFVEVLGRLTRSFRILRMADHARLLIQRSGLRRIDIQARPYPAGTTPH